MRADKSAFKSDGMMTARVWWSDGRLNYNESDAGRAHSAVACGPALRWPLKDATWTGEEVADIAADLGFDEPGGADLADLGLLRPRRAFYDSKLHVATEGACAAAAARRCAESPPTRSSATNAISASSADGGSGQQRFLCGTQSLQRRRDPCVRGADRDWRPRDRAAPTFPILPPLPAPTAPRHRRTARVDRGGHHLSRRRPSRAGIEREAHLRRRAGSAGISRIPQYDVDRYTRFCGVRR